MSYRPAICWGGCFLLVFGVGRATWGLDGTQALRLTPMNGWRAFELMTQRDDISLISDSGYGSTASRGIYDGLGIYPTADRLSIYVNHETTPASISRLVLHKSAFQQALQSTIDGGATPFPATITERIGFAYDRIFDGAYHAVSQPNPVAEGTAAVAAYGNAQFQRFCSGTSYAADAFGSGRGFIDHMYITGEEVGGGKYYAIDSATETAWEVPDFGLGSWENASQIDTGTTTHVGVILSADSGSDFIRLYVGEKNVDANADGTIDFLERNGMRGGTVYYYKPDAGFSTSDLPDGTVTGTWSPTTTGGLREDKLEDVHVNPADGTRAVITDQTDGIYRLELQLQFGPTGFDSSLSTTTIVQVDSASTQPVRAPDNIDWSADGKLYVQEDGDGNDIWQMNADGSDLLQIAHAQYEPSGIVDISEESGYLPGGVFLSSIQGDGSSHAQLVVLISPTATLRLRCDINGDGIADAADAGLMFANWGMPGTGDCTRDGIVDAADAGVLFTEWTGDLTGKAGPLVPEPTSAALLAAIALSFGRRRQPRSLLDGPPS